MLNHRVQLQFVLGQKGPTTAHKPGHDWKTAGTPATEGPSHIGSTGFKHPEPIATKAV
jgi:hypothetical protein